MTRIPLSTALIGVGAWGRVLAEAAARSSKISFTCCVGRSPERLAAFTRETGIEALPDMTAVLEDRSIRAVVLAVPNARHLELARLAARAGKHVYIEKPIANTMTDALRVARLGRQCGIRIVVGHCARLLPGNRLIRRAIDDGTLGKVTQIEANFSHDRALRLTPNDWRWYNASAPGGPLSQIGIHQFDTLRFLGGDIVSVSASAARHSPVGAEVEDQWIVCARFSDGKLGTVISSWTSPGTYNVRVTGTAALMFHEIDQSFWATPMRIHENASLYVQARGTGPAERKIIPVPPGNMYREELEMFADCVAASTDCELSAESACSALAAVHASIKSAAQGGRSVAIAEVISDAESGADARI